jgi:hypothetical protein
MSHCKVAFLLYLKFEIMWLVRYLKKIIETVDHENFFIFVGVLFQFLAFVVLILILLILYSVFR